MTASELKRYEELCKQVRESFYPETEDKGELVSPPQLSS